MLRSLIRWLGLRLGMRPVRLRFVFRRAADGMVRSHRPTRPRTGPPHRTAATTAWASAPASNRSR